MLIVYDWKGWGGGGGVDLESELRAMMFYF